MPPRIKAARFISIATPRQIGEQLHCHFLKPVGQAHLRPHDGALHDDHRLGRDLGGRGQGQAFGQLGDIQFQLAFVLDGLGKFAAGLGHRIDEGAAAEIRLAEPFRQGAGDRGEAFFGEAAFDRGAELPHPYFVAGFEEGADQVVLRREVPIERHLGDAGFGDDLVDSGGADAVAVKQAQGGGKDAVLGGNCLLHDEVSLTGRPVSVKKYTDLSTCRSSPMSEQRPPLPPFTAETARQKVRAAEDGWNSRDPVKVSLAYTPDSLWRNRAEFVTGREQIVQFLTRKWVKELEYRLIKELWAWHENRIAVRFAYEWRDDSGQWYRSYGNENWEFDENGLMKHRFACINDLPIKESERKFHWPQGRRPDDHPGLSDLGL